MLNLVSFRTGRSIANTLRAFKASIEILLEDIRRQLLAVFVLNRKKHLTLEVF